MRLQLNEGGRVEVIPPYPHCPEFSSSKLNRRPIFSPLFFLSFYSSLLHLIPSSLSLFFSDWKKKRKKQMPATVHPHKVKKRIKIPNKNINRKKKRGCGLLVKKNWFVSDPPSCCSPPSLMDFLIQFPHFLFFFFQILRLSAREENVHNPIREREIER